MSQYPFRRIGSLAAAVLASITVSACQLGGVTPDQAPIPRDVVRQIEAIGSTPASPIFIRLFKEEAEFEVWKRLPDGKYALLDTYAICAFSGDLGPKLAEGDRQAPEGFYQVTSAQMNPHSVEHLSFNLGFPNSFDQSLERTGSNLMVHGGCSSAGCYAITDETIEIVYALAREAFRGGQRSFQVHAFPFRMTAENLARHWGDPNMDYWLMLKEGYDHFEVTHEVPDIAVCEQRYVFNAVAREEDAAFLPSEACPEYEIPGEILQPLLAKQASDQQAFQIAMGAAADPAATIATISALAYAPTPVADDPIALLIAR